VASKEQSSSLLICDIFYGVFMPRGVEKGVSKQKFERTVNKIKRKGSAKNPYAVANAKLGRKGSSKSRKKSDK
jgi:hypothetical protein